MDALEQQKIQVMINLATQKFKSEIDELRGKVKQFETEISSLRNQLVSARQQSQNNPIHQANNEPQTRLSLGQQSSAIENEPAKQPIDRNGVAPADVSIEKMFYFGNKRF